MPREKLNKNVVKNDVKKKPTFYQRAKNFVSSNRKRLLSGTAGLVSAATILFLVNKYKKKGASPREAVFIASQETGVPVSKIENEIEHLPNNNKDNTKKSFWKTIDEEKRKPIRNVSRLKDYYENYAKNNNFGKVDKLKTLRKHLMVLKRI
jgi:hypothetical protein